MICLLGMGASIGQHQLGNSLRPAQQRLHRAGLLLQHLPHSRLLNLSSLYHSRAWGNLRAGGYLNAAALLQTELPPLQLLRRLLQIEYACGRRRQRKRWGKRAVDIDILLLDHLKLHSSPLQVPHPWLWQREFALRPAAELTQRQQHSPSLPRHWRGQIHRQLQRLHGHPLSRPQPLPLHTVTALPRKMRAR